MRHSHQHKKHSSDGECEDDVGVSEHLIIHDNANTDDVNIQISRLASTSETKPLKQVSLTPNDASSITPRNNDDSQNDSDNNDKNHKDNNQNNKENNNSKRENKKNERNEADSNESKNNDSHANDNNNENNNNNNKSVYGKNWPIFEPFDGPYQLSTYIKDYIQIKNEILVGIVVGCAQVPESVAFAFLAGVSPEIGLHAAWIIGFIVAFTGNRPGLISGATGAMAAILMNPIEKYGISYLFYTVILKGIIQSIVSFMGFEKIANLVPYTVNIGFVNGLAIIIAKSQINNFKMAASNSDGSDDSQGTVNEDVFVTGSTLIAMIFLSLLTFSIIEIFPKLTKIVPSSLVGITICTLIEHLIFRHFDITNTTLIGDISSLSGTFPKIIFFDNKYSNNLPSLLDIETWYIITPPAILTALVGMIECVMTIEVIDDLSNTPHLSVTQQLVSSGIANFISGFFGTMGGGATIGLSMICIHSGANGRYRISGCIAAIFLFTIIMVASKLIEIIPTAALIGVMLVVVIHTFEWNSLFIVIISFMPGRSDAFVIIAVTILTLIFDLAISVIFGVLFSSFWYVWQQSKQCKISKEVILGDDSNSNDNNSRDRVIYLIEGPLFFGNAHWIRKQFDFINDANTIEIHLNDSNIYDYSAMQALNFIGEKYKKLGKNIILKHVNLQSHKLITKAKDLFLHFEYETHVTVENEGNVHLSTPDRLHVINTKA